MLTGISYNVFMPIVYRTYDLDSSVDNRCFKYLVGLESPLFNVNFITPQGASTASAQSLQSRFARRVHRI